MGAPGTLIPAEVPSCSLRNFGLDIRSTMDTSESARHAMLEKVTGAVTVSNDLAKVVTASISNSEAASSMGMPLEGDGRNFGEERNQTERFEHDFGKLLPSLRRSNEGLSSSSGKPSAAKKLQVKDVSKYVISAAKNPDFAQKLHAVLSENDALPPSDLLSDIPQDQVEEKRLENIDSYNGERMAVGVQHHPVTFVADYSEVNKMIQTYDAARFVGSSGLVARHLDKDRTNELPFPLDCKPLDEQPRNGLSGDIGGCFKDNFADVFSNIEVEKGTCMESKETDGLGQQICCTSYHEKSSQVLGDVAEWEIPWDDLQIGERIGIGMIFPSSFNTMKNVINTNLNCMIRSILFGLLATLAYS